MNLSKNFTLESAIKTLKPFDNHPTEEIIEKGYKFANYVLQPIRDGIGVMQELSFYRSLWVNVAAGGVWDSQHLTMEALDFYPKDMSIAEVYQWIANSQTIIKFGQLILKPTFIHVSTMRIGKKNGEMLIHNRNGGYTTYEGGPVRVLD